MAKFQPLRRRVDLFFDDADPTDEWMAQRNAWVAARDQAEAAGRDIWHEATRSGQNTLAPRPDDLVQLGVQSLRKDGVSGDSRVPSQSIASDQDDATVALVRPIEPDEPLRRLPNIGFAKARPGDSISKLLGTSDPGTIGRFLALNAMDGRSTTVRAGDTYALPTAMDDGSPDEPAAGVRALRTDNARLAALHAMRTQARDATASQQTHSSKAAQNPSGQSFSGRPDGMDARKRAFWQAYRNGFFPGVLRGGEHAVEGLFDTAVLAGRLANPILDKVLSPPGRTAPEQIARTGKTVATAAVSAAAHPQRTWQETKDLGHHLNDELNPWAPLPATSDAAARRGLRVGENHGEMAFNAAAIPVGGELGATLDGLKYASKAGDVAKYLRAGHPLDVAEHLAKPYEGMDHHMWGRRRKLPPILGGGLLPEWLSESPLNRLHPRGIDRGQMYELHYKVDPDFHGAKLPRRGKGQGWSGKRLGLEKYSPDGQFWNGIPGLTKGIAAGALVDLGNDLNHVFSQDQHQ